MPGKSSYKRIESSAKTLQVLDFIMKQKEAPTAKEISDGTGLPVGTLMTHLATLEDEGWIERIHEYYRLTIKIALGWARKKSQLEDEIDKKKDQLNSITI